jgi:uncharacterized repeat protein (TIGR03803 family)
MKNQRFFTKVYWVLALALVIFVGIAHAGAKENVIFRFDGTHGAFPMNGLIEDAKGNLYGTTFSSGGGCSCGVVFELSPTSSGGWKETTLYTFKGGFGDGAHPWSGLVFDAQGDLFGETIGGGPSNQGTIFELKPGSGDTWVESIIFNLPGTDGPDPGNQLSIDSKGNLYGVLSSINENGGVFELSRQSNGTWKQTILYEFTGKNGDGSTPLGGVVLDSKGNLYGTTFGGGSLGYGTIFELMPNSNGTWTESILYNFTNHGDGSSPRNPLIIDAKGNLYGTTPSRSSTLRGTVFELSQSGGVWNQTVLYSFGTNPSDGSDPNEVAFDAQGNLYGTTMGAGTGCNVPGCGNAFMLSPQKTGPWKQTILHQFESAGDGSRSSAILMVDNTAGRLYGTTQYGGGRYGYGTVFLIER